MKIEFDPVKNQANLARHGISFDEAATALLDPLALDAEDKAAVGEQRFLTLGMSANQRLLVIVTTYRGESVRIISAWRASKQQQETYERKKPKN